MKNLNFRNQRILVVGGAGFIGSHLVDCLAETRPKALHVVDNLFAGSEENLVEAKLLYPNLSFHNIDATDGSKLRKLIRNEKIEFVFNLATKALAFSFEAPIDTFNVNTQIVGHLLESLRLGEIRHLVHFSSSEVYGSAVKVPMDEKHPILPRTPYAAGKAAADLMIRSYQETFGLKVLIIRPFNNYGPRYSDGFYAGVIPITIRRLLRGQAPVINGNGLQTRDFMYVNDTVKLVISLAKREELYGRVINIGTGKETSVKDIIEHLCRLGGYRGKIDKKPERLGDVRRHCADISLLRSLVGGLSLCTLDDGLAETYKWYLHHST